MCRSILCLILACSHPPTISSKISKKKPIIHCGSPNQARHLSKGTIHTPQVSPLPACERMYHMHLPCGLRQIRQHYLSLLMSGTQIIPVKSVLVSCCAEITSCIFSSCRKIPVYKTGFSCETSARTLFLLANDSKQQGSFHPNTVYS